jgi:hypothetical protein
MNNKQDQQSVSPLRNEIKSIQPITWRADNLQDVQTMEMLAEKIEKYGSLRVMKHLQKM